MSDIVLLTQSTVVLVIACKNSFNAYVINNVGFLYVAILYIVTAFVYFFLHENILSPLP